MFSPARGTVYAGVLVAFMIAVLGMGSLTGANIAYNETEGQAELANGTSEMRDIPTEVERDLERNMTGAGKVVVKRLMMPLVDSSVGVAIFGLQIGYEYPLLGEFIGKSAPIAMLSVVVFAFYRQYKRIRALQHQ